MSDMVGFPAHVLSARWAALRKWPRLTVRLIAFSLALAGSCASWAQTSIDHLPRLGDPSGDELSPQAERQLGEAIMRQIRRDPTYLDDAEATDFLTAFVAPLLNTPAAAGQRFQWFLVADGSINAFALPGGFIGIHTGLIALAQSESELAGVLAHEIAHVTQRHVARMLGEQRRASVVSMAAMALALLAARSNPQAAMGGLMLGDHVFRSQALSFSREAEREADRLGLEMLRQAGFDPQGMTAFFARLQQANRVYDTQAPVYLRTHPLTSDRIADLDARLQDPRAGGVGRRGPDSTAFLLLRARLGATLDPSGTGRQSARARAESAVRDTAGASAPAWFGLASIAAAQGDLTRMAQALTQARQGLGADHPAFIRLEAAARLEAGDAAAALALCQDGLQRFPQTRALVRLQGQALLALRDADRAVSMLEQALRQWPQDDALWLMLSQAHEQRGERARAHRAVAERFVLLGSALAAVDQLRRAREAGDPDFYIASMIDARMRELEPAARRELEESRQMGMTRLAP
jgi:predicted Zn-dependent protease